MKKIGFFGGCFNPPTNVHINIAKKLINEKKLDKVVFVPVNDYYKKEKLIEAKHRFNMLKLATNNFKELDVDDIEIKQDRELFAVDAFEIISNIYFAKELKQDNIFFIMGSDNYNKMPMWKNYTEIKDKYNYLVIERDEKEISATKIREMLANKDSKVIEYLPKEVYKYILKNGLYKL